MYVGYYYDPTYIVLLPAIIFALWAQASVKSAFNKYSKIENSLRISGADAARRVLDANGLTDVQINVIGGGALNNYYDPRDRTLNLSPEVYKDDSVASVAVACHEVGHAIQHDTGYTFLKLRNGIVPIVNFAQTLTWPLIIVGILLTSVSAYASLIFNLGVICFLAVVLFHLVTLPVELNASSRAIDQMMSNGLVSDSDVAGSRRVLRAAAMTYIAALATALANLLRILLIANRRND